MLTVLVVGLGRPGARAGVEAAQSPRTKRLFVAPGNAGVPSSGTRVDAGEPTDLAGITEYCRPRRIDLVVVGPEAALEAGTRRFELHGRRHHRASARRREGPASSGRSRSPASSPSRARPPIARPVAGLHRRGPALEWWRQLDRSRSWSSTTGLAAGQGRDRARERGRDRGGHLHNLAERPRGRRRDRARGTAGRGPEYLAARHLRRASPPCRCRSPRTTSGSARATPAPTPVAWAPIAPAPGHRTTPSALTAIFVQPVLDHLAAERHPVRRRALRRADADRRRARSWSSTTAASAIRRPRPAAARRERPGRGARRRLRGPPRVRHRRSCSARPRACTVVAAAAGYPECAGHGRCRRSRLIGELHEGLVFHASAPNLDAILTPRVSLVTSRRPGAERVTGTRRRPRPQARAAAYRGIDGHHVRQHAGPTVRHRLAGAGCGAHVVRLGRGRHRRGQPRRAVG